MPLFWISKSFVSHIEEEAMLLPKFSYCICTFLLLSRFQPIFVSFVAISAFVWRCFKAMSLVRIVPSQGPQIRSFILLMMDIIKPGSHLPLPYLWHSCWYCLGYCSDKKKKKNIDHQQHWSSQSLPQVCRQSLLDCKCWCHMFSFVQTVLQVFYYYIISNTNNIIFSKMLLNAFTFFCFLQESKCK